MQLSIDGVFCIEKGHQECISRYNTTQCMHTMICTTIFPYSITFTLSQNGFQTMSAPLKLGTAVYRLGTET